MNTLQMVLPVAGAACSVAAAYAASYRAARQPLQIDTTAEMLVVGSVLAEPRMYSQLVALRPQDFAITDLGVLWAKFGELAVVSTNSALIAEATRHRLPALEIPLSAAELAEALSDVDLTDVTLEELTGGASADLEGDVLPAGERVAAGGLDRLHGAGTIAPSDEPTFEQPLVRKPSRVTWGRVAACAVVGAAAAAVAGAGIGSAAWGLAAALVLITGLTIISLVDIDTLYIDMPVFWATLLGGGGLVAAYANSNGTLGDVAVGAVTTAIGITMTAFVARVYLRFRGRVGLGGGDLYLLAITLGVIYALSGDYRVPMWGFLAGCLAAIAVQVPMIVSKRASREDPHPFGPYLAFGWVISWALVLAL